MADPDRLRDILLGARALIAACPCKDEGLLACHRCLLGVTDRPSVSLVTRPLALEQLDELLSDWATEPVATVADLQIDELEESELERLFRAALVAWDAKRNDVLITAAPGGRHYGFEVRITTTLPSGGADAPAREEVVRWRIREQQDVVTGGMSCRPDFLFTRLDSNPQEIAVFVDGEQFHASPEHDRLADDANKRNTLRSGGRLVWSLTWTDIQAFLNAQTSDVDRTVRRSGLLSPEVVQRTQHLQQSFSGTLTGAVAGMNAMEQLVRFLRAPVTGDWEQLACSAGAAAAKDNVVLVDDSGLVDTLRGFLDGHPVTTPPVAPTSATGAVGVVGGLAVILDLRSGKGPNEQRWTALALTPDGVQLGPPDASDRWKEWLLWSNLAQFLQSEDRQFVMTTTSLAKDFDLTNLYLVNPATAQPMSSSSPGSAIDSAELADVKPSAEALLQATRALGVVPAPIPGFEPDSPGGWPIELGWPSARVGVVSTTTRNATRGSPHTGGVSRWSTCGHRPNSLWP